MTLTLFSRSQEVKKKVGKCLVCILSPEGMNGFLPNLHRYIFGDIKNWSGDLDPISKVTGDQKCQKMH